tara:strand:+ start:1721 stop:1987 length:267 start_codon:yes stop_codon:yes gene_type:complete
MLFIEFLRDIHLVSNLLTFIMLQFFLGIGVGVYLGTEYNFRPYVDAIKNMASKIEKRKDSYDADSDSDSKETSGSWSIFGGSKNKKSD